MPHELTKDLAKNRLYLRLEGLAEDDEVKRTADAVIAAMQEMRRGFTVVTDITDFRPVTQAGVEQLRRISEEGLRLGMQATARVVGKSLMVSQQFSRVDRDAGYVTYTASSREEADRLLDEALSWTGDSEPD
jgi:hypothetical protein